MTQMTNALVLSAGGILGAFQAGAISAILKQKQYAPNGIFGSSAGAINGAFLADRAGRQMSGTGRIDWARVGDELVQFWRQQITGPNVMWKARSNREIALQICGKNFRGLLETEGTPQHELYRKRLRDEIKKNNLKHSGVDYRPGTVDLFSGRIEYPYISDNDIIDFIIASSAIPIAMDCVEIKRNRVLVPFVDGGTRDVAPLSRAVEEGYTNIICIACQSENLTSENFPPRTIKRLMPRLMTIVINETVNNDLKTIDRYKQLFKKANLKKANMGKIFQAYDAVKSIRVIRPDKELDYDDMNFTRKDIKELIDKGIAAAAKSLANKFRNLQQMKASKVSGGFTIRW
jgi:NTE family protein